MDVIKATLTVFATCVGLAVPQPNVANAKPDPTARVIATGFRLTSTQIDTGKTTEVPPGGVVAYRVEKSCYNWLLTFKPFAGQAGLTEKLLLPGRATVWNSASDEQPTKVKRRGKRGVTQLVADGSTGFATNGWCVARGDPAGAYRFIIKQGGRTVAKISFIVGDTI